MRVMTDQAGGHVVTETTSVPSTEYQPVKHDEDAASVISPSDSSILTPTIRSILTPKPTPKPTSTIYLSLTHRYLITPADNIHPIANVTHAI